MLKFPLFFPAGLQEKSAGISKLVEDKTFSFVKLRKIIFKSFITTDFIQNVVNGIALKQGFS